MAHDLKNVASFIWNSNLIENINYSYDETFDLISEYDPHAESKANEKLQKKNKYVINHYRAYHFLVGAAEKHRPKWPMVLQAHKLLMEDQLPPSDAGHVRKVDVQVGGHIPPFHGPALNKYVREFEKQLAQFGRCKDTGGVDVTDEEFYKLIYEIHTKFEYIHPFRDGNGRSGRLLWAAHLAHAGFEFNEIDFDDRPAYYRSLQQREGGKRYPDPVLWYPPRNYK